MVIDTREKINDAMQVLFSRDSKLRRLQAMASESASSLKSAHRYATDKPPEIVASDKPAEPSSKTGVAADI